MTQLFGYRRPDGRVGVRNHIAIIPVDDLSNTVVQNVAGTPALSVPFGILPTGLPFGLQFTAPHYHDVRLLDLAAVIEEAFPWPRSAPGYQTLSESLGLD